MRYAVFGDIHGNLEALTTVLAAIENENVDAYVCMGDIVGYGANPEECVNLIRDLNCLCIAGNHDHAVIGALDTTYFNRYARQAALWTRDHLSEDSKDWLRGLPFVEHLQDLTFVHGSLQGPELFNYVQTIKDAEFNFRLLDKAVLFLGHSHQPLAFFNTDPMTYTLDPEIPVDLSVKSIVNVGSVGQPRDEDPRAAFCIFDDAGASKDPAGPAGTPPAGSAPSAAPSPPAESDQTPTLVLDPGAKSDYPRTGTAFIHRLEYDVETASGKILEAGLPESLALRLTLGK